VWDVEALLTDLTHLLGHGAAVAWPSMCPVRGGLRGADEPAGRRAGHDAPPTSKPNGLDEAGHGFCPDLIRLGAALAWPSRASRITRVKYATFTPGGRVMEVKNPTPPREPSPASSG